jgi:putative acetyltransferase
MDLMTSISADDLYGFIATENEQLIGSIFFTRMKFESDINAFILAPVAISTHHQGKGVGRKLINHGLDVLYKDGVELIVTYGDPNFYSRVGFRAVTGQQVPPPMPLSMPHGWQAQSLSGNEINPIAGKSYCVDALTRAEYW